uniref:Uncharacterized protein n=1 Tax=Timema genevievae TaxID=629358 RepID=A0A7R9PJY6_TIMGE|nr:unnamed protein product [Timema genevievae]
MTERSGFEPWSDVLRSILHVEVLDPQVCLYNSSVPHGLMKLKLRLLEAIGNKILLGSVVDFSVIDDAESAVSSTPRPTKKKRAQPKDPAD